MDSLIDTEVEHTTLSGFDGHIAMLRAQYTGLPFGTEQMTSHQRGAELEYALTTEILPFGINPNICIVGVGYDNLDDTRCPFVPYRAAAVIEAYDPDRDYSFTMVDVNGEVLRD